MFKIQNFFKLSRQFFNKTKISQTFPNNILRTQMPFTKCYTFLPTTCLLGTNLLSMNLLKAKTETSIQPEIETILVKSERRDVAELIEQIATELREDNFDDAKTHIDDAIRISEANNYVEYLPQLYDYLVVITLHEGKNELAEEILVRSIEKLTEIGYKEADNAILRLQLILCRLYQVRGDSEMAGLGFRNCLSLQENKFKSSGAYMDEDTSSLYLSILFWYSMYLSDQDELIDSRDYMEKALKVSKSSVNDSTRKVVILHKLAELSFRLKDFDATTKYLVEGLRLCLQNLSLDSAIPVFMVKLGLVYLVKGMHDAAGYWCSIAQVFAKSTNNACVENEASLCLKYLREGKSRRKHDD